MAVITPGGGAQYFPVPNLDLLGGLAPTFQVPNSVTIAPNSNVTQSQFENMFAPVQTGQTQVMGDTSWANVPTVVQSSQNPGMFAQFTNGNPLMAGQGIYNTPAYQQFMQQALYGPNGGQGAQNPIIPAQQQSPIGFGAPPQWQGSPYQAGPYDQMLQQLASSSQAPNMNSPDMNWLRSFVQGGGSPVNWEPAWQSMIDAQQGNIDRQAGNLNEFFNTMGGRFSTAYGDAMGQFHNQATKDQNAQLLMMQTQALENAKQRQLSGGSTLAGLGFQGESDALNRQLQAALVGAGMNNQRYMQNNSYQYGLENQFRGHEFAANMYNAQMADQSAQTLAMLAAQASQQLGTASNQAAQLMFGGQTNAMGNLFAGQQNAVPQWLQALLTQQGMNTNVAGQIEGLNLANLGLGGQLGGQQFNTLTQQINAGYQEWLRQQPQYNPLLNMMFQGAYTPQGLYNPQFTQSPFQIYMQALSALTKAGAAGLGGG